MPTLSMTLLIKMKKFIAVLCLIVMIISSSGLSAMAESVTDPAANNHIAPESLLTLQVQGGANSFSVPEGGKRVILAGTYPETVSVGIQCGFGDWSCFGACGGDCPDQWGFCHCSGDELGVVPDLQIVRVDGYDSGIAFADITDGGIAVTGVSPGTANIGLRAYITSHNADGTVFGDGNEYTRYTETKVLSITVEGPGENSAPVLEADSTDNMVGQDISLSFEEDAGWRAAITDVMIDGFVLDKSGYTTGDEGIVTIGRDAFPEEGDYEIVIAANGYMYASVTQSILETTEKSPAPAITADDLDNTAGKDITLSFEDDPAWRAAITGITVDDAPLDIGSYNTSVQGIITIGKEVFPEEGSYSIRIMAKRYEDAVVAQVINLAVTPPDITADSTDNTVGQNITLTFEEDLQWRTSIYGITVGTKELSASLYDTSGEGQLTIDKSAFASASSYEITIKAVGYSDALITQNVLKPQYFNVTDIRTGADGIGIIIKMSFPSDRWKIDAINDMPDGFVVTADGEEIPVTGVYLASGSSTNTSDKSIVLFTGERSFESTEAVTVSYSPGEILVSGASGTGGSAVPCSLAPFSDWPVIVRELQKGYIDTYIPNDGVIGSGQYSLAGVGLSYIKELDFDAEGNLYAAVQPTSAGEYVVKIDASTGISEIVAGNGRGGVSQDPGYIWYLGEGEGKKVTNAASTGVAEDVRISPQDIAIDKDNNIFIAEGMGIGSVPLYRVLKLDAQTGMLSVYAGIDGRQAYANTVPDENIPAAESPVFPQCIDVDSKGNLYIYGNYLLRKVDTNGIITTLAGTVMSPSQRDAGDGNGDGGDPRDNSRINLRDFYIDSSDRLYFFDTGAQQIRMIDLSGETPVIQAVAGDYESIDYEGRPALKTNLGNARGVVSDPEAGSIYYASGNNIYRIGPGGMTDIVAGNGVRALTGDMGPAIEASLYDPQKISVDPFGRIFLVGRGSGAQGLIRYISPGDPPPKLSAPSPILLDDVITWEEVNGASRYEVSVTSGDGATEARMTENCFINLSQSFPYLAKGVYQVTVAARTADGVRIPFGSEPSEAVVYEITDDVPLIPTDAFTSYDGRNIFIEFYQEVDISNLPEAPDGFTVTVDGKAAAVTAILGADTEARFIALGLEKPVSKRSSKIALSYSEGDIKGANGMGIQSFTGMRAASYIPEDGIINTVIGNGTKGAAADGRVSSAAGVDAPGKICFDKDGSLYIIDGAGTLIRKVNGLTGKIETVAGGGEEYIEGEAALEVKLKPSSLATDSEGILYILEKSNNRVLRLDAETGTVSVFAGAGQAGYGGDGGPAPEAELNNPTDIVFDSDDNLYISDTSNYRIRKVDSEGNISTAIGTGNIPDPAYTSMGNGGYALAADIYPGAMAIGQDDKLYIAEISLGRQVRMVDLSSTQRIIKHVAGDPNDFMMADGVQAVTSNIGIPESLAVDRYGSVYISQSFGRVRKVSSDGIITTVAGEFSSGYSGDGGPAAELARVYASSLAVYGHQLYFSDSSNHRIRMVQLPSGLPRYDAAGKGILPLSTSFQGRGTVTVKAPEDADVYYTIDGTEPDGGSAIVEAGGSVDIVLTATATIKAVVFKEGFENSAVLAETYTITQSETESGPKSIGMSITPWNGDPVINEVNGVVTNTQTSTVSITYDGAISAAAGALDELEVAINGTVYDASRLELSTQGSTLNIKIFINFAPYAGYLTIKAKNPAGVTKITGADGESPVQWEDIACYMPNGVKLATVSQTVGDSSRNIKASVTKNMSSLGKTRAMVHFVFLKNGELEGAPDSYGASFVAHYHDYAALDAQTFTGYIVNGMKAKYGDQYTFTQDGASFTVEANSAVDGDVLDVRVFAYPQDRDTGADKGVLQEKIEEAEAASPSEYTGEEYRELRYNIARARAVLNGIYYLQPEVDAAAELLGGGETEEPGEGPGEEEPRYEAAEKGILTQSRVFTTAGTVTVKAPSDADVYYTTDGTAPGRGSNKVSAGTAKTIVITKTTVIKAIAAAEGYRDSEVITATYTVRPAGNIGDIPVDGTAPDTSGSVQQNTGEAAVKLTRRQIEEAIARAAENGGSTAGAEIRIPAAAGVRTVQAAIPLDAIEAVMQSEAGTLTISSPIASITLDRSTMDGILKEAGGEIRITVTREEPEELERDLRTWAGGRPVYGFTVEAQGEEMPRFSGRVKVSVPYTLQEGENASSVVIYYIDPDGSRRMVRHCDYNAALKRISFSTGHFSRYAVGYNSVEFKDVDKDEWYADFVGYLAARGVVKGKGTGRFDPDASITRAEFVQVLANMSGEDLGKYSTDAFTDVTEGRWYMGAVAWAYEHGIVLGNSGRFNPAGNISRQDMAVMILRYSRAFEGYPLAESAEKTVFSDSGSIAGYAEEAAGITYSAGILGGKKNNTFDPEGQGTRAEAAQTAAMLMKSAVK